MSVSRALFYQCSLVPGFAVLEPLVKHAGFCCFCLLAIGHIHMRMPQMHHKCQPSEWARESAIGIDQASIVLVAAILLNLHVQDPTPNA